MLAQLQRVSLEEGEGVRGGNREDEVIEIGGCYFTGDLFLVIGHRTRVYR